MIAFLPDKIDDELKTNGRVRVRRHECAVVLFADIVGFTDYCDTHHPEEVLETLTRITLRFEGGLGTPWPREDQNHRRLRCMVAVKRKGEMEVFLVEGLR